MKKTWIFLAVMAIALVSCNKETIDNTQEESEKVATEIVFNLTANHPEVATKAVKTGWETGDVLYVFLDNVAAPKYLKMSYDGSAWTYTQMNGSVEESLGLSNGDSGTMRAVYLPFGNALTVADDGAGAFTFSETTYSYYLTATLPYTVTAGSVSGAFDMAIPAGYIQFFLDDAGASSSTEIELREPHLTPQGIASIAADGTITHTSVASGAPLKGYVYDKESKTVDESKGYLFSGILAAGARNTSTDYYFTLVTGGWEGTYYSKDFADRTWYRDEAVGRALKMPALSGWTEITDYKPIDLGCDVDGKRIYWSSRNLGATADSGVNSYGDYYAWGEIEPYYSSLSPLVWKSGKDDGYAWTSYSHCDGTSTTLTKYCLDPNYGKDGFTDLSAEEYLAPLQLVDDAARHVLGRNWRIPTQSEFSRLSSVTNLGAFASYGRVLSGKGVYEGRSIFLPAAGFFNGVSKTGAGSQGLYWNATHYGNGSYSGDPKAWRYFFNSEGKSSAGETRRAGLSIRPITE